MALKVTTIASRSILLCVLTLVCGCSTIGYNKYLVPEEENGWMLSGRKADSVVIFEKYGAHENVGRTAEYQCKTTKLEIGLLSTFWFGLVGPPVIPIIPVRNGSQATLELRVEDTEDPWMEGCPVVRIAKLDDIGFTLYGKAVFSNSTRYHCKYKISGKELSDIEDFQLLFKFNACETKVLRFKKESEMYYCMFCIPAVAG